MDNVNLNEIITDSQTIIRRHVVRDGFVFTRIGEPVNVFDTLVVRTEPLAGPEAHRLTESDGLGSSGRSLEEHIALINQEKIEKIYICGTNIDFIKYCPSLKYFKVIPSSSASSSFDYSPLYEMPTVKFLFCLTAYGPPGELLSTTVDCTRLHGLEYLRVQKNGFKNFSQIATLKTLEISQQSDKDLTTIFSSPVLDSLGITQCSLKSLNGLGQAEKMQCLHLYYNRSLQDISALRDVKDSIKELYIENCPKIEDFSVLYELTNLERLELIGSNSLPSLDFIRSMKKLSYFKFSMNVLNGDLSPCMNLHWAASWINRKHYNLRDAQLPKKTPKPEEGLPANGNIEGWRRLFS